MAEILKPTAGQTLDDRLVTYRRLVELADSNATNGPDSTGGVTTPLRAIGSVGPISRSELTARRADPLSVPACDDRGLPRDSAMVPSSRPSKRNIPSKIVIG